MAFKTQNVAVGTTAIRIDLGSSDDVYGYGINATNTGPNTVTYGGPDVVAGVGDFIPVDGRLSEAKIADPVYAICATGESATVNVTVSGA